MSQPFEGASLECVAVPPLVMYHMSSMYVQYDKLLSHGWHWDVQDVRIQPNSIVVFALPVHGHSSDYSSAYVLYTYVYIQCAYVRSSTVWFHSPFSLPWSLVIQY